MFKKLFAISTVLILFIGTFIAIKKESYQEIKQKKIVDQQYRNIVIDRSKKGIFIPTANMNIKRYSHVSLTLPSGKVLVIGGDGTGLNSAASINSAELYDPKTQNFSRTGNLNFSESPFNCPKHAILLPSGKVAVLHSYNIEIYDPATNKFYTAGHLSRKRKDYAADILPDGKILITGGRTFDQYNNGYGIALAEAEIYDPVTQRVRSTSKLNFARFNHRAITLKKGTVLIIGGQSGKNKQAKAELYNPKTGKFSIAAEMLASRYSLTATLLSDGRVLITGEIQPNYNYNNKTKKRIRSGGGWYAEIYDPDTNKFTQTGDMTTARIEHSALLLSNNHVLIVGGNKTGEVSTAEIYNPKTNNFSATGSMHYRVSSLQTSLLKDGKVLISGGIDYNYDGPEGSMKDSDKAEIYIPE